MIKMPSPVRSPQARTRVETGEFERTATGGRGELEALAPIYRSFRTGEHRDPDGESLDTRCPATNPADEGVRCSRLLNQESVARAEIERELHDSGFPLQNVRCLIVDSALVLTGHLARYYHVQVAIQIALRLAKGRQIVNEIKVQPAVL